MVAGGSPRNAQHRDLLRTAVRQRLPSPGRHGGGARSGAATHRGRPDRAAADGTGRGAYRDRGSDRRRRRGPRGADRDRPARPGRGPRRTRRSRLDGARTGPHQTLGTPLGVAADRHRLATHRRRTGAAAGDPAGGRPARVVDGRQRGRLRLPVAGRDGSRVHPLVPGSGKAPGRAGVPAQPAVTAGRDPDRLGGAGTGPDPGAGRRDGGRVRGRRVGTVSSGQRWSPHDARTRSARPATCHARSRRWW